MCVYLSIHICAFKEQIGFTENEIAYMRVNAFPFGLIYLGKA